MIDRIPSAPTMMSPSITSPVVSVTDGFCVSPSPTDIDSTGEPNRTLTLSYVAARLRNASAR